MAEMSSGSQNRNSLKKAVFGRYRSPVGDIFAVSSGRGIDGIFIGTESAFFKGMGKRGEDTLPLIEKRSGFTRLFTLFDLYFAGHKVEFDFELNPGGTVFERKVWRVLTTIPYGEVRSYGWVAGKAGCPGGARAVGRACWKNPFPIVIPCHRVVCSSGELGGYSPYAGIKAALLKIEGVSRVAGKVSWGNFLQKVPPNPLKDF